MTCPAQSAFEARNLKPEHRNASKSTSLSELLRSAWQSLLAEILCRTAGEVS